MKKMTLQELSEKSGITVAYLSMIERSQREPTLSTLFKIASALNVRTESLWTDLSTEEREEGEAADYELLTREQQTGYKRLYPGVEYESITTNILADGKSIGMVGHVGRLLPGADTNPEGKAQHDEEELIYMFRGTMLCELAEETLTLREGDSLLLYKHTLHKFVNISNETAEFLMVRYVQ